jgi:hypothetical protein
MRLALAIALALFVAGCEAGGMLDGFGPVCKALGANADPKKPGPIRYTTQNKKSLRYAGPALAPDLKTRNLTGEDLRCPNFKKAR